jgi:hypothetical protein
MITVLLRTGEHERGDRRVVSRCSGIQAPKSQDPHWVRLRSQTGVRQVRR